MLNVTDDAAFFGLEIAHRFFDGFAEQIAVFVEIELLAERENRGNELENVGGCCGESGGVGKNGLKHGVEGVGRERHAFLDEELDGL